MRWVHFQVLLGCIVLIGLWKEGRTDTEVNSLKNLEEELGDEVIHTADIYHRQLRRRRKKDIASLLKHEENTDPHYVKTSDWWEVTHPFLFEKFSGFNNKTMHLYLRNYNFDNSVIHSCYQYRFVEQVENSTTTTVSENQFCYPAIMITGVPKCSTSAVYQMLKSFDHSRSLLAKEVCPGMFYFANLFNYFDALSYVANDGSLGRHEFIVTACIDLSQNIAMHEILRQPKTFYISVVRDYSDWLWSSYNYWCIENIDPFCDLITHWVNAEFHHRSPEHFHSLVTAERVVPTPVDKWYVRPISVVYQENVCSYANRAFYDYVHALWTKIGVENTLIFASEELERNPASIVNKLVQAIGFTHLHFNVEDFQSVRYNTNKKVHHIHSHFCF